MSQKKGEKRAMSIVSHNVAVMGSYGRNYCTSRKTAPAVTFTTKNRRDHFPQQVLLSEIQGGNFAYTIHVYVVFTSDQRCTPCTKECGDVIFGY